MTVQNVACLYVATAERKHPLPHCVDILCLVSVNVQQVSVNVSQCSFSTEEFSDTPWLHMHFHVRCHSVRLPLCCHLSHGNKTWWNIDGKVQPLLPYHRDLPLDVLGQHNKIGGITHRAALVVPFLSCRRQQGTDFGKNNGRASTNTMM